MIPIKQNETLDGYMPYKKANDIKKLLREQNKHKQVIRECMILWMSGFYIDLLQILANDVSNIMDDGIIIELMNTYDKFIKVNRKKTRSKVRNDKRLRCSIFLSVLRCSNAKKSSTLTRLPNTYRMGALSDKKVKMEPYEIDNSKLFFYDPQIEEINDNIMRIEFIINKVDEAMLSKHAQMSKLRDVIFKSLGYLLERAHPKFTQSSAVGNTIVEYLNMSDVYSIKLWAFLINATEKLEKIIPDRIKRIRLLRNFIDKYDLLLDSKVKIHLLLKAYFIFMTDESCLLDFESSKLADNVVEKWKLWVNDYWDYLVSHYKKHNKFPIMRSNPSGKPVIKQSLITTNKNTKEEEELEEYNAYRESLRIEKVPIPMQLQMPIPKSEREVMIINISSKRKKGKRRSKKNGIKAVISKVAN